MTLRQSASSMCLAASAGALIIFSSWVNAADDAGQAQQSSSRSTAGDSSWSLRLPQENKVSFRGVVSFDEAGAGNTQLLYPAPNAVGFLAAVLTHGAVVESQKKKQKDQIQEAADKVLSPYETVLSHYTHKELMQRGLQKVSAGGMHKLIEFSKIPDSKWLVVSAPVFLITQDQSAIILENSIAIHAPDTPSNVLYQNTIRVVSETKEGKDLTGFWTANQGEKLKEESAGLFAQSLDIAMSEMANGSNSGDKPQKTFRYLEGHTEKMERGQLISEQCNRMVIKTLRGGLISIPARRDGNSGLRC